MVDFLQAVQQNDERYSKGFPFFSNKYIKNTFGSPQTHVFVTILKYSDHCFHSIGGIHRPSYLEYVHNTNIVVIYII